MLSQYVHWASDGNVWHCRHDATVNDSQALHSIDVNPRVDNTGVLKWKHAISSRGVQIGNSCSLDVVKDGLIVIRSNVDNTRRSLSVIRPNG